MERLNKIDKETIVAYSFQKMHIEITKQDVKALEVYLRLLKMPSTYRMERDLTELMHWLDLTSDDFVFRLRKEYPR